MKSCLRKFFALAGTVGAAAIQSGCPPPRSSNVGNPDRVVTISPVSTGVCQVDYPVALLRKGKHTIAWAAETYDYWIRFDPGTGSPIDPTNTAIKVTHGQKTPKFPVSPSAAYNYYMYAIYDKDPGGSTPPPTPCKAANDDHDTGLNIKP